MSRLSNLAPASSRVHASMAPAARCPAAVVWRGALLASLAAAASAAPLPVYDDGLASGWSGGAYAATSGAFNFSSAWAHLGSGRAIRAALAPFGTLVFRSSRRDVSADAAWLALYVNPLGDPGSAPAAAPLALSISIATWLPGNTAMPVASLCTAAQIARGGQLLAGAPDGGPGCAISGPDADGWQRLAVDVDGFGAAGWDEVQVSDVTGHGGVVYLDRIALLSAADVAQPGAWDANKNYCLDRYDSLQYGCTVPPSQECCADYSQFNAQGCYCNQSVREQGGDDLQRASPTDLAAAAHRMTKPKHDACRIGAQWPHSTLRRMRAAPSWCCKTTRSALLAHRAAPPATARHPCPMPPAHQPRLLRCARRLRGRRHAQRAAAMPQRVSSLWRRHLMLASAV